MKETGSYFDIWSEEGASQNAILEENPDMESTIEFLYKNGAIVGQRTYLEHQGIELEEDTILYVSDSYKKK